MCGLSVLNPSGIGLVIIFLCFSLVFGSNPENDSTVEKRLPADFAKHLPPGRILTGPPKLPSRRGQRSAGLRPGALESGMAAPGGRPALRWYRPASPLRPHPPFESFSNTARTP